MKTPRSESIETSILSCRTRRPAPSPIPGRAALTGALRQPIWTSSEHGGPPPRSSRGLSQEVAPGVGAIERLGQFLGSFLLLGGQHLRHLDLEPVANVAATVALGLRRPLAAQALDRAVLGPRPDLDLLRALQRRHL